MERRPQIFACVGPESSGKTTLCNQLATHFNGVIVPEFAREYLTQLGRPYEQDDLFTIAENQLKLEQRIISASSGFVFCDTDIITVMVWLQVKYRKRNKNIERLLDQQQPRKYLLTTPDLPWKPDPLRESPDDLELIFKMNRYSLKMTNSVFSMIEGSGEQRLTNAIAAVNQMKLG